MVSFGYVQTASGKYLIIRNAPNEVGKEIATCTEKKYARAMIEALNAMAEQRQTKADQRNQGDRAVAELTIFAGEIKNKYPEIEVEPLLDKLVDAVRGGIREAAEEQR